LGVAALALAASAAGLANGFAYDDLPVIVQNPRLHDLHRIGRVAIESYWPPQFGGTLYRPLTSTLFALEWAVGRGSALPFHVMSVALYVAAALAVYALASRILPRGAAWLAAAVFAVHPVHVEAVANVVGQSELIVTLAVVGAVAIYIARRAADPARPVSRRDSALLAALYAVACLAKEHGIVLPALLLAAEGTVLRTGTTWRARTRLLWPLALSLGGVGIAYLALRGAILHGVVGEAPTIAFRQAGWGTRWWTMLGVVPEWVRLLVWPAHLAAVYSPPATPVRDAADPAALLGLLLLIAVGALAILMRRRSPVLTFGIAWAAVALLPVSNLIVRSGVLLAERTLFLPSVGAVIAFGAAAAVVRERLRAAGPRPLRMAEAGVGILLLAGVGRSAGRQGVWRDDPTLFVQSVVDEPFSYAAHFAYADWSFMTGHWETGEREGRFALRLYDGDPRLVNRMGTQYFAAGRCDIAVPLLRRALVLVPSFPDARVDLATCLERAGDWAALRPVAADGLARGANVSYYRSLLAQTDSADGASAAPGARSGRRGGA
jgi:hypothetical protein